MGEKKSIVLGDHISFEQDGINYEVEVISDTYVGENLIHIVSMKVVWTSAEGDISYDWIKEEKAKWLYENYSECDEGPKGKERWRANIKKHGKKKKSRKKFNLLKDW